MLLYLDKSSFPSFHELDLVFTAYMHSLKHPIRVALAVAELICDSTCGFLPGLPLERWNFGFPDAMDLVLTKKTGLRLGCEPKNSGFSPQIIHLNFVFHYKPIHFGVPLFLETPTLRQRTFFKVQVTLGISTSSPKKKVAQLKEAEKKQSWQNQQVAAFNWNELIQNRRCRCTGIAGDAPLRQACKTSFHMTCAKVMLRLGLTWKLIASKGQLQKHVQYKNNPMNCNDISLWNKYWIYVYMCVSIPHQECNFVTMCDSRQNHATSNRTNIRLNNVQNVTFLARKYLQKLLQMLQIVNHHRWLSW